MGITDKVKNLGEQIHTGAKNAFVETLTWVLKGITGIFLGLTLGMIGQELMKFGTLMLVFFTIVITGVFLRLAKSWGLGGVLIFDLICVLVSQILRMYILLAPNM